MNRLGQEPGNREWGYLEKWRGSVLYYVYGDLPQEFYDQLVKPRVPGSDYESVYVPLTDSGEPSREGRHAWLVNLTVLEVIYVFDENAWRRESGHLPELIEGIWNVGEFLPGVPVKIAVLSDRKVDAGVSSGGFQRADTLQKRYRDSIYPWILGVEVRFLPDLHSLLKWCGQLPLAVPKVRPLLFQVPQIFPETVPGKLGLYRQVCVDTDTPSLLTGESLVIGGLYKNLFDQERHEAGILDALAFVRFMLGSVCGYLRAREGLDRERAHLSDLPLREIAQEITELAPKGSELARRVSAPEQALPQALTILLQVVVKNRHFKKLGRDTGLLPCDFRSLVSLCEQLGKALPDYSAPGGAKPLPPKVSQSLQAALLYLIQLLSGTLSYSAFSLEKTKRGYHGGWGEDTALLDRIIDEKDGCPHLI